MPSSLNLWVSEKLTVLFLIYSPLSKCQVSNLTGHHVLKRSVNFLSILYLFILKANPARTQCPLNVNWSEWSALRKEKNQQNKNTQKNTWASAWSCHVIEFLLLWPWEEWPGGCVLYGSSLGWCPSGLFMMNSPCHFLNITSGEASPRPSIRCSLNRNVTRS